MPLDQMDRMPHPGPEIEIVRLKAAQTRHFIACGNFIQVYRTHWDQAHKQTIPCFTPHEQCEGHLKKLPQRAKGYLHCLLSSRLDDKSTKETECFLELTPVAAQDLRLGCNNPRVLRGVHFSLTRLNGAKAHLKVAVWPNSGRRDSALPEPRSAYESLMRMWGFLDFPPENAGQSVFE
jgi:hypothetical protein